MDEIAALVEELKETEAHIYELDLKGFQINEELLAKVERLKVELSFAETK